jgi:hypothetical protein
MTKKEAIELLERMTATGAADVDHWDADNALCAVLRQLGHEDLAEAYEHARKRCDFWYS